MEVGAVMVRSGKASGHKDWSWRKYGKVSSKYKGQPEESRWVEAERPLRKLLQ